jgi:PII-like signaling protein
MVLPEEGHLLRIFIGEDDRHEGLATLEKVEIRFYRCGGPAAEGD